MPRIRPPPLPLPLRSPCCDGDYDKLYAFGDRSFSIRDGATGALVFDSGSQLERIEALVVTSEISGNITTYDLDTERSWQRRHGGWWKKLWRHSRGHR